MFDYFVLYFTVSFIMIIAFSIYYCYSNQIGKYNVVLGCYLINISLYALVSSTNLFHNETLYCFGDTVQFRAENYFLVFIMVLSAIAIFYTVIRMLDKAEKTIKELREKDNEHLEQITKEDA